MKPKHWLVGGACVATGVLVSAGSAMAADAPTFDPAKTQSDVYSLSISTNLLWVVVAAALVVFMQAGFALLETGFCRAKNAAHVVGTNIAVFGLGVVGFFICGYAFMFGGFSDSGTQIGLGKPIGGALIGSGNWVFLWKGGWALTGVPSLYKGAVAAFFLYMAAFMDTAATIPTGAMAERWRWKAFIGWGLFAGAIYYPLFGAWTWGGGWLAKLGNSAHWGFGYVDFAGSGVVHAVGGIAALTGAVVLGPRIGKFTKEGKPRAIPGHHIPMAVLGTLILLLGWFGFNAGSTLASSDIQFTTVATNTAIAAAFGCAIGMFWIMFREGKPDIAMICNGMLAGLVAITAPCAFVDPWAAAVIGSISAVIVVEAVFFFERKLKIDDPVGALGVHLANGLFGVLCVGIFANGRYGQGWNAMYADDGSLKTLGGKGVTGILYGGHGWGQLAAQATGALTIIVVMGGLSYGFFKLQDKIMKGGIRTPEEDELVGLDVPEMGVQAYPEFAGALGGISSSR